MTTRTWHLTRRVRAGVGLGKRFKGEFVFLCHKFRYEWTCLNKKRQNLRDIFTVEDGA